jgi:hypothetical protein
MALKITKEGNLIKVVETTHSWHETKTNVVLYNLSEKRSKINNDPWYEMTDTAIEWVMKYYLPKVEQ